MKQTTSNRNWDSVDPKMLEVLDKISQYSDQLHVEEDLASGKDFLMFKDKIKLQKSFNRARENVQNILNDQKDKMIDYFDNQLEVTSKCAAFDNDSSGFAASTVRTSFRTLLKPKTLNRNHSADDLIHYEEERPSNKLPHPEEQNSYRFSAFSSRLKEDNLVDSPISIMKYKDCGCSSKSNTSTNQYDEGNMKKITLNEETNRSSFSCGRLTATTCPRDSSQFRDFGRSTIWEKFNERQISDLQAKIEMLQDQLYQRDLEIQILKNRTVRSSKTITNPIQNNSHPNSRPKQAQKLSLIGQSLSFIDTSTQDSIQDTSICSNISTTRRVRPSSKLTHKQKINRKIANWCARKERKKEQKFKKLYLESQELVDTYENTLHTFEEKYSKSRLKLKESKHQKEKIEQELAVTMQAKDLITEKFVALKKQMVDVLESVQQRLKEYNEKDEAYQGLLDENKAVKLRYEQILVRYKRLAELTNS